MTARPILFSAPMIKALLDGRKTQTRRILKPQPLMGYTPDVTASKGVRFAKGDRLWVRETHYVWSAGYKDGSGRRIDYRATTPDAPTHWTPGIHMPRWASRLTLTVSDVRVERLQDISEADAIAEGMCQHPFDGSDAAGAWTGGIDFLHGVSARGAFCRTWGLINGLGSWDANPWVVALTFSVERGNIDA